MTRLFAAFTLAAAAFWSPESLALDRLDNATVRSFGAEQQSSLDEDGRRLLSGAIASALDFRNWMASDPARLETLLSASEAGVLRRLIATGRTRDALLWREFFRGSIIALGHGLSDAPRVGYYNPLVDGWVIADFSRGATGLTLQTLSVTPGGSFVETSRGDDHRAPWLFEAAMPMPSALAMATAANVAAFERVSPPLSTATPKGRSSNLRRDAVERRLDALAITIGTFRGDPSYEGVAADLLAAVSSGDPARLAALLPAASVSALPVERVFGLSTAARRSFELRGGFHRPDGNLTIVFGTPFSGQYLLFADLDVAGGTPRFSDAVLLDLGQL